MYAMTLDLNTLIAAGCLIIGLVVHYWGVHRGNIQSREINTPLVWFFLALTLTFLIFWHLPDNAASGSMWGFEFSGPLAGFIAVWTGGIIYARHGKGRAGLEKENRGLKAEIDQLRNMPISSRPTRARLIPGSEHILYDLKSDPSRKIGLQIGGIEQAKGIDIWVNSENTNMQMARYYDRSVSGTIRYLGAERDKVTGEVTRDIIGEALQEKLGNKRSVDPGTVLHTVSGKLAGTHKVKLIFHVASVQGAVGVGYQPIGNIEKCVWNVLGHADAPDLSAENPHSILIPLMGTGTAAAHLEETAQNLIDTAVSYFMQNSQSRIKEVYFLAWSEVERDTCRKILERSDYVVPQK